MSQWTHVNAVIRFDAIMGVTPIPHLRRNIPCGSEGPLACELMEVGDGMARFVAIIWGDLRNYENVSEIIGYLSQIVSGQSIRSGIAEIAVEYQKKLVLRYDDDAEEWKTVWEQSKATGGDG